MSPFFAEFSGNIFTNNSGFVVGVGFVGRDLDINQMVDFSLITSGLYIYIYNINYIGFVGRDLDINDMDDFSLITSGL